MSSVLGMPVGAFFVAFAIALGLLLLYRPAGTTTPRSTLAFAFIACVALGLIFWPYIAPMFTILYGVK